MSVQNVEAIAAGFPEHLDRYSQSACEQDPQAAWLASCLETMPHHQPPESVKLRMKEVVLRLFADMPVRVLECKGEPYLQAEDMRRDVRDFGRLFVRKHMTGPVTGHLTWHWRAVHDYYGHVLGKADFTLRGEWAAYGRHVNDFPRACWPFLLNNVVTENAYRLNRGHFYCDNVQCGSKIIYLAEHFGPQGHWYRQND